MGIISARESVWRVFEGHQDLAYGLVAKYRIPFLNRNIEVVCPLIRSPNDANIFCPEWYVLVAVALEVLRTANHSA